MENYAQWTYVTDMSWRRRKRQVFLFRYPQTIPAHKIMLSGYAPIVVVKAGKNMRMKALDSY